MLVMTITDEVAFCEVEDSLQTYYDIIGCDLVEAPTRKINGKKYDIICDEEGLLKPDPIVTAVNRKGRPQLVGYLVIVNYTDEGEWVGLSEEDVLRLSNAVQYTIQQDRLQPVIMLDD